MTGEMELGRLRPHPKNYNKHSEAQIGRLMESLRRFGQPKEVVVWAAAAQDAQRLIIAGHGLVEAARRLGWKTLRAQDMTGRWSEAEALAFMAADNELARLGDPDEAALAALVAELGDVDAQLAALAAGTEERLKELVASVNAGAAGDDPGAQVDKAAELQVKWGTASGQLWELGAHRLICGDCTDAAVVARVMGGEKAAAVVTDPPYGMNNDTDSYRFSGGQRKAVHTPGPFSEPIIGDDRPFDPTPWLEFPKVVLWGFQHFASRLPVGSVLVWIKKDDHLFGTFLSDADLAWMKGGCGVYCFQRNWSGFSRITTVGKASHPNEKPIEVMSWCIEKVNVPSDAVILDPFSGSGTTLIACEKLGRRARCVEIEPGYVAVALERWATMTGKTPVLLPAQGQVASEGAQGQ